MRVYILRAFIARASDEENRIIEQHAQLNLDINLNLAHSRATCISWHRCGGEHDVDFLHNLCNLCHYK